VTRRAWAVRNQEFALAAAQRIAEQPGAGMVVGSIDSDGTDGPGVQLTAGVDPAACLAGGLGRRDYLQRGRRLRRSI